MNKIEEILERNGILIGSKAWGGFNENSDIDFAISRKFKKEIVNTLLLENIEFKNNNYKSSVMFNERSIKFKIGSRMINILFYTELSFPIARMAFENVKTLSQKNDLSNKEIRHLVCEASLQRVFKDFNVWIWM